MTFMFKDRRFRFSLFEESLMRVLSYSIYVVLGASSFVLLFSDIQPLRWFGVLLALFLVDRALQVGKGERRLWELGGKEPNVARSFTPRATAALYRAFRESLATGEDVRTLVLQELLKHQETKQVLRRLDVSPKEFSGKLQELRSGTEEEHQKDQFEAVKSLALSAASNAARLHEAYVYPANIFGAIAEDPSPAVRKLFYIFEIDPRDAENAPLFRSRGMFRFRAFKHLRKLAFFAPSARKIPKKTMNRAWTARPTPLLDAFSTDLTALAEDGFIGFLVGHEKESQALSSALARPGKPNAILVGEPGAGKSTIINHLALQMVRDEAPKALFDKRLVSLDLSELMSGADLKGVSERITQLTEEILHAKNVVLAISNVEYLFKTSAERGSSPIDFFLPVIESKAIPVVAEVNSREFKKFIEPRADFLKQFDVVRVDEISEEEAIRFLVYASISIEEDFSVTVTFRAIRRAVELSHRYFRNRMLPGSALDVLKQAAAEASRQKEKTLSEDQVVAVAERQSRIPIQKAEGKEVEKLLNLEAVIHERLVNQNEAVSAVSRALREFRSGLSREGGPIASFLFVGPTGVGKTELAKILAAVQFGSETLLRRFDMSEYQEKQSIFQLIGTPDGEKTGALTDAVLENPYSLVLLDEFEKAHSDILNLFLQVMDDGRLTDSLGRTVDFSNTILIATSNAHSDFIKKEIEKKTPMKDFSLELKKKLTEIFRPELVNRFSDIIVFRPLVETEIEEVAKRMLQGLIKTMEETHGVRLSLEESAIRKIAELGYSPVFGARPLRQAISEKIRSVLAEKLLKKEIGKGNSVSISFEKGAFEFSVVE